MKTKFISLLLAFALLLSVPAYAVQDFGRQRTYAGEFSDLTANSPFYDNVAALYEYGLSNGKTDGTFGLQDSMTVGQIIIFAGRIHSLCQTGDAEAGPNAYGGDGDATVTRYLRYLQAENVLGSEWDASLTSAATRAQVAHVLAKAMPSLPSVNDEAVTEGYASHRYITDVNEYTPYYQDILDLYRKGISAGSDAAGTYHPDQPITRGAAAAMLTRIIDPSLRVTLQWDLSSLDVSSAAGSTLGSLVEPGTYYAAPSSTEELDSALRYMLSQNSSQIKFEYANVTVTQARKLMSAVLGVIKTYCEQSYNEVHCSLEKDSLTLTFTAAGTGSNLESYRAATMEAAVAVRDQLWADGTLHSGMTDMEKARVYFDWICNNCVYDYTARDSSISHIPYNLFTNHTAVCDGYTGAYNLFLKLEGIECYAFVSGNHIWSVATLDGVLYHIDTTWGDTGSSINYDYFAMTPQQSDILHKR